MTKTTWAERQRQFKEDLNRIRELPNSDPQRQRLIEAAAKRQRAAMLEEELAGLPEWVKAGRRREQKRRELEPVRRRTLEALAKAAHQATDDALRDLLTVRAELELTRASFAVWYQEDEELVLDRQNGRHQELTRVLQTVAEEVASLPAEVTFHSHQHVREKCGGDYRKYLS